MLIFLLLALRQDMYLQMHAGDALQKTKVKDESARANQ